MNRAEAKKLYDNANTAFKQFAKANGVELGKFRGKFDSVSMTLTITLRSGSEHATQIEQLAKLHGIASTTAPSGRKLIDYNSRAHRFPWIYEQSNGKRYKCTTLQAKSLFGSV